MNCLNDYMSLQDACRILDVGRQRIYQLTKGENPDIKTERINGFQHYSRVDVYRLYMDKKQRSQGRLTNVDINDIEKLFNLKFLLNQLDYNENPEHACDIASILWELNHFLTKTGQSIGLPRYYLERFVLNEAKLLQAFKENETSDGIFHELMQNMTISCEDEKLGRATRNYELLFMIMCLEQDVKVSNNDLLSLAHFLTQSIENVVNRILMNLEDFIKELKSFINEIIIVTTNIKEGGLIHEY